MIVNRIKTKNCCTIICGMEKRQLILFAYWVGTIIPLMTHKSLERIHIADIGQGNYSFPWDVRCLIEQKTNVKR